MKTASKNSRIIKFRGISSETNEFVYGSLLLTHIRTYIIEIFNDYIQEMYEFKKKVNFDTLGQFTGRKDLNDKEIYEGDIVQSHDEILTVIYNSTMACFDVQYLGGDVEPLVDEDGECNYTVIGNIHQNPELLK